MFMRYCEKIVSRDIIEKYKYIIGWGAGGEFRKRASAFKFLDFIVDTGEKGSKHIGECIEGIPIYDISELKKIDESQTLIIIFPNIETEIQESISNYFSDKIDTVVGRLVDCGEETRYFSVDKEDVIILDLINKLKYERDFSYMDIGVCHPVVRNNTFLLYENGYKNGVLIEPNLAMCELCKVYRPENTTVNCGATGEKECDEMTYYFSKRHPGLNTFSKSVAEKRPLLTEKCKIPVMNINEIIDKYCKEPPKILDIDTEGMDYELLKGLDTDKYLIEIICAEGNDEEFYTMMNNKGYVRYCKTKENTIFVRNDTLSLLL